jgi:hypothetical protein
MTSIHPRTTYKDGKKKNTSRPPKDANKGYLGKAQQKLHERRLAHTATLADLKRNSTFNPAAFRTPGSMRKDKN